MSDLQSSDGLVTFCPVAGQAQYAQNDGQGRSASDGTTATGTTNKAALQNTLGADMGKQSLSLFALSLGTSETWVYYQNDKYQSESEAAGRVLRLLMADMPPTVEVFHLIALNAGEPMQDITVARSALERVTEEHGTSSGLGNAVAMSAPPLDNPALDQQSSQVFPYFYWSLDPKLTEHMFDPDRPMQFQLYGQAGVGLVLAPGLQVESYLTANIWNDLLFIRGPGSVLPHVRTDLLQYLKKGADGISTLEVNYRTRLARDVYAEAKVGYLEDMYMGAGGEILWRPEDSRLAIGADLYQVMEARFDRLFGAQEYNILTGHVSFYYNSPWYGLNFNVHIGRIWRATGAPPLS